MKQKEIFGNRWMSYLESFLSKEDIKRVFLVTGKTSYEISGAKKIFDELFNNLEVKRFYEFDTNPKFEDVKKGIHAFKSNNHDAIVAVGGGSVIDMAKLILFFSMNPQFLKSDFSTIPKDGINPTFKVPFIAVPTTMGSGSEATHFAVVYKDKKKYSIASQNLLPDLVVLDPCFVKTLPRYESACSGIDAFAHALESWWSVNSTTRSRSFSRKAIHLITRNIIRAVNTNEIKYRSKMLLGANLAGKAINIAKTTACHALSYSLTSFFKINHGQAVALFLGPMLSYNWNLSREECVDKRGIYFVKRQIHSILSTLKIDTPDEFNKYIFNLLRKLGLKSTLHELNVPKHKLSLLVANINIERLSNNPRRLSNLKIKRILLSLF